ncbi:5-(carboxyamino)imidazole ribonucleotide synthase [Alteromonas sp. a30]|uniref:5-(carboxyamino)imidazole ribonucleotide synthase n=1 Tax=Alteromonas sp. a30 TaxID=2730917 RepID=UPI002280C555|nr:5-(carboxyamino)imidazole ribonucleotide synthase [Alteromonas sp. a30]MCY7294648.1 5-(carboxyamino)imidazole ribonucleotide synthase [Alteromonas sp. a30]
MNVLIFGSGQLARMMYLAGCPLGVYISAVDVNKEQVVNPVSKARRTISIKQAIEDADAITVEFEHVPEHLLQLAHQSGKLKPGIEAILAGADRVREKRLLEKLNIPNCPHQIIQDIEQIAPAMNQLGDQLILKASRDGYDGYGQWRLTNRADLVKLEDDLSQLDLTSVPLIAEKMLKFDRELSLVGTRSQDGSYVFYPLVENRHHQGQLHLTIAPATNISDALTQQAQDAFKKLGDELGYVGVLAVEFFQIGDKLLVNEIAPRVHNSGHWSMQGADTCQFENHIRAVCDLPIGQTDNYKITGMINIIGLGQFSSTMLAIPGSHLHWYGKEPRAKRKLGHFNLTAETYQQLGKRLSSLTEYLPEEDFPLLVPAAKELQIF